MPLLRIETSESIEPDRTPGLLREVGELVADGLVKSIDYVQVLLEGDRAIQFGGEPGPSAMVQVVSLGMDAEQAARLSPVLCDWMEDRLGVPPERIYLAFHDHPRDRFGWNGKTFG